MSVPVVAPTRPALTAGVAVAPRRTRRPRDLVATILLYAVLVAGLLVMVGPFLWMLMSSFKTEGEVRLVPPTWWPQHPTLANYHELFARLDFPKYFRNSAIVAGLVTLGNLVFCSAVGYALAKLPFPGRRALFGLVLGTVMVPGMVTFVPLFVLVSNLHLVNTYAGLVLTFLGSWNNFLWPLVVATTEDKYTLPVALALYSVGQNQTRYGLLLAGSVVVVLPVLIVFVVLQRHFVRGIATTGLK